MSLTVNQTFRKHERLASRKMIEHVVEKGKSFSCGHFRCMWLKTDFDSPFPVKVAFSVPKKNISLATDRNKVKRRMREAWRKNKHLLYPFLAEREIRIACLVVLTARKIPDYKDTSENIITILKRLAEADK
jgi:ribonuclease P protein component